MSQIEKISILEIKSNIIKKQINKIESMINLKTAPYFAPSLFWLFTTIYFFVEYGGYEFISTFRTELNIFDFFKIYFQHVFLFFGATFSLALVSRYLIDKNKIIIKLRKIKDKKQKIRDEIISEKEELIKNFKEIDFLDVNINNNNNLALIDELLDIHEKQTYSEQTLQVIDIAVIKTKNAFAGKEKETEAIKKFVKIFEEELRNDKSRNRQKRLENIQEKNHNEITNIMIENE